MNAGDRLYSRFALITSGEKLSDRFLYTGSVPIKPTNDGPILLFSIEVTRPWFPSSRLVPTISNVLSERFSTIKRSNNPLKSFEAALKNVNEELYAITEQGETDWIGYLNAIIGLVVEDEVHIAQTGNSTAYLFRQRKISQITDEAGDQAEPHPLTTFSNIISGQVTEGDRLVLSNQDLFSLVSLDQIRAAVTDQTPWLAANQLGKNLRRSKITSISTIILAIEKLTTWQEAGEEPLAINLEENLQSWHRQAWKKAKPYVVKLGELGKSAWQFTKVTSKKAQQKWQESYGPKTKELLSKGAASISSAASKAAQTAQQSASSATQKVTAGRQSSFLQPAEDWLENNLAGFRQGAAPVTSVLSDIDNAIGNFMQKLKPYLTGRNFRYVVVSLAILFILTIIVSARQKHNQLVTSQQRDQNESTLSDIQTLAGKIDTVIAQNQTIEAQNLLIEANTKLTGLKNLTTDEQAEKDSLISVLQEKGDKLNNTTRLTAKSTLDAPANSKLIVATEKGVVAFTTGTEARYFVKELAGSQQNFTVDNPVIDVQYNKDRDEIFALTNNKQLLGIRRENDKVTVTKKENPLGDFAESQIVSSFGNNLYLLDNINSLIWKYAPSGDNFQRGINQIDPADVSVSGAKGMAIDGYIYVLQKDGTIVKLLRGKIETSFVVNGLPKANDATHFTQIFTNENTDYLFVLDDGGEDGLAGPHIILLTKDGLYVKQFAFDDIDSAVSFTIDTTNKEIWLLSKDKISEYQF